jgi:hypothetical protein
MGDDLKYPEFFNQFQMPDDEKKEADMKEHEKDPKHRIVSSHRGKKERIVERPQPPGTPFRIDLKGCRIPWFSKELYESHGNAHNKDRKGEVHHWNQDDIVDRLHGSPLSLGIKRGAPSRGHRQKPLLLPFDVELNGAFFLFGLQDLIAAGSSPCGKIGQ